MKNQRKNIYYILLILYILLIFTLNSHHINQQGTFNNIFIPIAENIISGDGYTCSAFNNTPLTYPLWGYTLLILPDLLFSLEFILLFAFQFSLTLISIYFFYKIFQVEYKYYHIFLFTPFIALMSVKWPDAIVAGLLIISIYLIKKYLELKKIRYLIVSGLIFGLILNFRSEYLYLFFFIFILMFFVSGKHRKIEVVKMVAIHIFISLLLLLPWAIRSYQTNGDFRLTASNGGAVMYISLGQLPNNTWRIDPIDATAYKIADSLEFNGPYSNKADTYFKKQTVNLIKLEPFEYAKKAGYNFLHSLFYGVYTGEYANYFLGESERNKIEEKLSMQNNIWNKIKLITNLNYDLSIPLIFEKSIQMLFIPIFLIFIIKLIFNIYTNNTQLNKILLFLILAIIIYKFGIISFIQYEYRHMNSIYLLILGLSIKK